MIIGLTALALIMGLLGRYVAMEKNRSKAEGFWLGFLFSILGVIIIALLPTIEKEKPTELTDERRKEMELKADALKVKGKELKTLYVGYFIFVVVLLFLYLTYLYYLNMK